MDPRSRLDGTIENPDPVYPCVVSASSLELFESRDFQTTYRSAINDTINEHPLRFDQRFPIEDYVEDPVNRFVNEIKPTAIVHVYLSNDWTSHVVR